MCEMLLLCCWKEAQDGGEQEGAQAQDIMLPSTMALIRIRTTQKRSSNISWYAKDMLTNAPSLRSTTCTRTQAHRVLQSLLQT